MSIIKRSKTFGNRCFLCETDILCKNERIETNLGPSHIECLISVCDINENCSWCISSLEDEQEKKPTRSLFVPSLFTHSYCSFGPCCVCKNFFAEFECAKTDRTDKMICIYCKCKGCIWSEEFHYFLNNNHKKAIELFTWISTDYFKINIPYDILLLILDCILLK